MSETAFRDRLSMAMKKRNITPGMLSIKTGISDRMIRNYLRGSHQATAYSLKVLAKALGVTADWLLGLEGE